MRARVKGVECSIMKFLFNRSNNDADDAMYSCTGCSLYFVCQLKISFPPFIPNLKMKIISVGIVSE